MYLAQCARKKDYCRLLRTSFTAETRQQMRKRSLERDNESDGKVLFTETPGEIIIKMVNRLEADTVRSIKLLRRAVGIKILPSRGIRFYFFVYKKCSDPVSDELSSHLRARAPHFLSVIY